MANTLGTPTVTRFGSARQFQALWSDIWTVSVLVSDQDAVADDVSVDITCTVPGVALGDIVLFCGATKSVTDANAGITLHAAVTAANTVTVRWVNIDATTDAYDADTLTDGYIKMVIGRPTW